MCLVTPRFVSGIAGNSLDCDEAVRFIRIACMFRVIYFGKSGGTSLFQEDFWNHGSGFFVGDFRGLLVNGCRASRHESGYPRKLPFAKDEFHFAG